MAPKNFLKNLTVPSPCPTDWNSMIGNDQVRFCEHCRFEVHNLSLMTRSQAERLAQLAQSLQQVATISTASSQSADGAAAAAQAQITAMGDLTATSQQLAQLAERLRASIARFSVLSRDGQPKGPPLRAAAD